MAPLQVRLVLADGSAPDEDVALQALHGAADGQQHRVDLNRNLPGRRQYQDLQPPEQQ